MVGKIIGAGIAALCIALAGCNSGNGTAAVAEAELLGRWNFTQAKFHSHLVRKQGAKTLQDTTTDTTVDVSGKGNYVEFKDSSKFTADVPTELLLPMKASAAQIPVSGTWSIEGSLLSMAYSFGAYKDTLRFSTTITGNKIVFFAAEESTEEYEGITETESSSTELTATKQ